MVEMAENELEFILDFVELGVRLALIYRSRRN